LEQRTVFEPLPSLADGNGAKQDPFHHRSEDVVAGIDSVLDIAKLVGEADLPVLGVEDMIGRAGALSASNSSARDLRLFRSERKISTGSVKGMTGVATIS
jgi:hypothetical protein